MILDSISDPSSSCHIYYYLPHQKPGTGSSPVVQPRAGAHRTKPTPVLSTLLPTTDAIFSVFVVFSVFVNAFLFCCHLWQEQAPNVQGTF